MFKKSSSKRALTMSVISLALCFVMLLGTTFAWFTASTSSLVNTVKSGNLYIDIVDENDESLVGKAIDFVDGEVLWEPGSTYAVEDFFIKNTGTCDIKYKIEVIGLEDGSDLASVIDWTVDGSFTGTLKSGKTSKAIAIEGTMQETAGNQYMNKEADGIAIAVYATQAQAGDDAFEEVAAIVKELDVTTIDAVALDTAYTFSTIPGAYEDTYGTWNADYIVTFDQEVPAGAVTLAGAYDTWNNGAWESFSNPEAIPAGQEIRLLKDFRNGTTITYNEICELVSDFNCGAASNVSGLTVTVELRLFEVENGVETGNYVTPGAYTYTF